MSRPESRPARWPDPEELERALLGEAALDRGQVARRAGVDEPTATRLWRAMGFVAPGEGERVFTEADVEALRRTLALVARNDVAPDEALNLARASGGLLSRLADAYAEAIVQRHDENEPEASVRRLAEVTDDVDGVLRYIWRRHLLASLLRHIQHRGSQEQQLSVGFADIVSFSALARAYDDSALLQLLERFESQATDRVVALGGRVVKMIGDEVLFVADDVGCAAEIAFSLVGLEGVDGLPAVHIGMGHGCVLVRQGDVYGEVVNIAARLADLARAGTVLVDRGAAEALEGDGRYALRSLRPISVRGYQHLHGFVLRRAA